MIKVLINGCNGKMSQEVIKIMDLNENFGLLCGFDKENTGIYSFPVYTQIQEIEEKPDVIIDFSVPVATFKILEYAKKEKIPTVIATTGFTQEEDEIIKGYSKYIPVFKSANMSVDINLMAKIVSELAKVLNNTDIEIVETHHNRKIDSPSGTALFLADNINLALGNSMNYVYNRHDNRKKREKNEIGISSIRGGNIVGEHTVKFFAENEMFEVKHICYSRSVFAEGALKAAKFLVEKAPGLYGMNDLLSK